MRPGLHRSKGDRQGTNTSLVRDEPCERHDSGGEGTQMEAGGIEPPSRDCFRVASTCVVNLLCVRRRDADRHASHGLSQTVVSQQSGQTSLHCQLTNVVVHNSERLENDGLPIVRQPWHTSCCHIRFIARGFTRPPDNLGTPQSRLLARSNPIAPVRLSKD